MAHGNLGWPSEFGLNSDINNPADTWIFAAIQAVPWFTAAILGLIVLDPASECFGRYVCSPLPSCEWPESRCKSIGEALECATLLIKSQARIIVLCCVIKVT